MRIPHEDIEAAKKKKVQFGRTSKAMPNNWQQVIAKVRNGNIRLVEA